MIHEGTTPTHVFTLPFDTSIIAEVKVVYAQGGRVVLEKRTGDCQLEGDKVTTRLTQEDTFAFDPSAYVHILVRVLTTGGDALMSSPIVQSVARCFDDEVLV